MKIFDLKKFSQNIAIGRASDNSIVVSDASASSHHAVLSRYNGDIIIRDIGSTNGTFVNGNRISQQILQENDNILIGNIFMHISNGILSIDNSKCTITYNLTNNNGQPQNQGKQTPIVALTSKDALIGRSNDCALVLSDETISSHHAVIKKSGKNYYLYDNNSANGVFVNNQKTTSCMLQDGNVIQIGRQKFYYGNGKLFKNRPTTADLARKKFSIPKKGYFIGAGVAVVLSLALLLTPILEGFRNKRVAKLDQVDPLYYSLSPVDLLLVTPYYHIDMGIPGEKSEKSAEYFSAVTAESLDAAKMIMRSYTGLSREIQKSYKHITIIMEESDRAYGTTYLNDFNTLLYDFAEAYVAAEAYQIEYKAYKVEDYGHDLINTNVIATKIDSAVKAGAFIDISYLTLADIAAVMVNANANSTNTKIRKSVSKLERMYNRTDSFYKLSRNARCAQAISVMQQYLEIAKMEEMLENLYYSTSMLPQIQADVETIKRENKLEAEKISALEAQIDMLSEVCAGAIACYEEEWGKAVVSDSDFVTSNILENNTGLLIKAYAENISIDDMHGGNKPDFGQCVDLDATIKAEQDAKKKNAKEAWATVNSYLGTDKGLSEFVSHNMSLIRDYGGYTLNLYNTGVNIVALKAIYNYYGVDPKVTEKKIQKMLYDLEQGYIKGTAGSQQFKDTIKVLDTVDEGIGQTFKETGNSMELMGCDVLNYYLNTNFKPTGYLGKGGYLIGKFGSAVITSLGKAVAKVANPTATIGEQVTGTLDIILAATGSSLGTTSKVSGGINKLMSKLAQAGSDSKFVNAAIKCVKHVLPKIDKLSNAAKNELNELLLSTHGITLVATKDLLVNIADATIDSAIMQELETGIDSMNGKKTTTSDLPQDTTVYTTQVYPSMKEAYEGDSITFSTPRIKDATYEWRDTSGNISHSEFPSADFTYPDAKIYDVFVRAFDANGESTGEGKTTIEIFEPEIIPNGEKLIGYDIIFSLKETLSEYIFDWSINGGEMQRANTVKVAFQASGDQTITCLISRNGKQVARVQKNITIAAVSIKPDVEKTYTGGVITYSTPVVKDATYHWSDTYGNKKDTEIPSVAFHYPAVGNYEATVEVTDAKGKKYGKDSTKIEIVDPEIKPNGDLAIGEKIDFSINPVLSGHKYDWTFSDNSTQSGETVTKVFDSAGKQTIDCRITKSNGDHITNALKTITIAGISITPKSKQIVEERKIIFKALPNNKNYTYRWSHGSTTSEQEVFFEKAGIYTVSVDIWDEKNIHLGEVTSTITVVVNPNSNKVVKISPSSQEVVVGTSVTFTAEPNNANYTYQWSTNSSTTSQESVFFEKAGPYTVSVEVWDDKNQYLGNASSNITVTEAPSTPEGDYSKVSGRWRWTADWSEDYYEILQLNEDGTYSHQLCDNPSTYGTYKFESDTGDDGVWRMYKNGDTEFTHWFKLENEQLIYDIWYTFVRDTGVK